MSEIHPSAFVDRRAEIGRDVSIGPFCYVGPEVVLGDGCRLAAHVTIEGPAIIGRNNRFYPQCVVGAAPQDLKYRGGPTRVVLGDDNIIREAVTIHRGTEIDRESGGTTRVGDRCLLMVGVHVAHDATVGNAVIIGNGVQIAGHCSLEDYCNIGGMSGLHHFVTIGRYAFVGGMTRINFDVPPYCIAQGADMRIRALNAEGLKRWGMTPQTIGSLKTAFRQLFRAHGDNVATNTLETVRTLIESELSADEHVRYLVEFVRRQLADGVHGRTREKRRIDVAADRGAFYQGGKFHESGSE